MVVQLIVLIKTWLPDSGECPRLTAVPVDGRRHSSRHDRAHHMRHVRSLPADVVQDGREMNSCRGRSGIVPVVEGAG